MKQKSQWSTVFRAKALSKEIPRIGTPASVQPGDILTFTLNGSFHAREVATCHREHIVTAPLESDFGLIDGPRKVKFTDFCDATRRGKIAPKPKPKAAPATKPKPKAEVKAKPKAEVKAKPAPKPKAKAKPKAKRTKAKKAPPAHLLDFLDGKYRGD